MSEAGRAHKALVTGHYGRLAATYDRVGPRVFSKEGRRLAELAQLSPGASVLDVASGRGAVLFAAAALIGERGHVVGVDLTPEMVELTSEEIRQLGLKNAEIREMDAEALDFRDGAFDFVLCGYGLFFFAHLEQALSEFFRVLKPGGRFAASTDGRPDERWAWLPELLTSHHAQLPYRTHPLHDPDELVAALKQAGFTKIQMIEEEDDVVYPNEEEWWATKLADIEMRLAPHALGRFKAEAFSRLAMLKRPDGMHRLSRARYHLAAKPDTEDSGK